MKIVSRVRNYFSNAAKEKKLISIYEKYKDYTMIPLKIYLKNLRLIEKYANVSGCVVECGVWRGGMAAGMSELLGGDRTYYLFDSFEGLPQAKEIDGKAAIEWQNDKDSPGYRDNCKAEISYAEEAMRKSRTKNYHLIKGWFEETLPNFALTEQIAFLRLDADWYESTTQCLNSLYPKVAKGGLIIIDDYYAWDGCSRAVHDYLSRNSRKERIMQFQNKLAYIIKQD